MNGRKRLAVFLSAIWFLLIAFFLAVETPTDWLAVLLGVGILPLAALWGIAWVIRGFKQPN